MIFIQVFLLFFLLFSVYCDDYAADWAQLAYEKCLKKVKKFESKEKTAYRATCTTFQDLLEEVF